MSMSIFPPCQFISLHVSFPLPRDLFDKDFFLHPVCAVPTCRSVGPGKSQEGHETQGWVKQLGVQGEGPPTQFTIPQASWPLPVSSLVPSAPGTPVVDKARLGERGLRSLASGPLGLCLSLCLV